MTLSICFSYIAYNFFKQACRSSYRREERCTGRVGSCFLGRVSLVYAKRNRHADAASVCLSVTHRRLDGRIDNSRNRFFTITATNAAKASIKTFQTRRLELILVLLPRWASGVDGRRDGGRCGRTDGRVTDARLTSGQASDVDDDRRRRPRRAAVLGRSSDETDAARKFVAIFCSQLRARPIVAAADLPPAPRPPRHVAGAAAGVTPPRRR